MCIVTTTYVQPFRRRFKQKQKKQFSLGLFTLHLLPSRTTCMVFTFTVHSLLWSTFVNCTEHNRHICVSWFYSDDNCNKELQENFYYCMVGFHCMVVIKQTRKKIETNWKKKRSQKCNLRNRCGWQTDKQNIVKRVRYYETKMDQFTTNNECYNNNNTIKIDRPFIL